MDEIGYLIKQAQHALRLKIDKALAQLDLTMPQYVALSRLQAEAGISNAELARRSFVTPQTMHRIVQGLERQGLLERRPHPQLERVMPLALTQAGQQALQQAATMVAQIEQQSLAYLTDEEVAALRSTLEKVLAGLAEIEISAE